VVSLAVLGDREQGLERVPLGGGHVAQHEVAAQLKTHAVALRM